jgi:hypothetical protein
LLALLRQQGNDFQAVFIAKEKQLFKGHLRMRMFNTDMPQSFQGYGKNSIFFDWVLEKILLANPAQGWLKFKGCECGFRADRP